MSTMQPARLIALGFFAAFLAGCGGGGGSDNGYGGGGGGGGSSVGVLVGKVVGSDGGPIPGAQVSVDGMQATALSQGGFQVTGLSTGVHRVYAQTNVRGATYSGSTQVLINSNQTTSNAIVSLSPSSEQGVISGTVVDSSGRGLRDARVFLSVPVSTSNVGFQSVVAFTDGNGQYQLQNVSASNKTPYMLAASLLGYQNDSVTFTGLGSGQTRGENFQLAPSSNQSTLTPQNLTAQSFTQPSSVLTPQARAGAQAHTAVAGGSVYEQIRRTLSPAYARAVSGLHPASQIKTLRTQSHLTGFGNYAVSTDLLFDESARDSLSGFRVYEADGNAQLTAYDFLQDPLANSFTDLNPAYVADQSYRFAVSAVNTDSNETGLSNTATVVPLSQMILDQPGQNQTINNPLTVSWQGVNGASAYAVFVYNEYPTDGSVTVAKNQNLTAGDRGYTFPGNFASGDYWVVAAASADNGAELSVSQITLVHIR